MVRVTTRDLDYRPRTNCAAEGPLQLGSGILGVSGATQFRLPGTAGVAGLSAARGSGFSLIGSDKDSIRCVCSAEQCTCPDVLEHALRHTMGSVNTLQMLHML